MPSRPKTLPGISREMREVALGYAIDATQMAMFVGGDSMENFLLDLISEEPHEDRLTILRLIRNTTVSDEAWAIVNKGE